VKEKSILVPGSRSFEAENIRSVLDLSSK